MYRNVTRPKCPVTETAQTETAQTETAQTETVQTETARPKNPVLCDLTVAMIDKTSNGFNLCCH